MSSTTRAIRRLQAQLAEEKTAHAATRNRLKAEIERIWRLVPTHYITLMGVYPALRRLLHVLGEAADLQDPTRGAPIEDVMRVDFVHSGDRASSSQPERAEVTHRRHRANVRLLNTELTDLVKILEDRTDRMARLIPGTEWAYSPPDGECRDCGGPVIQPDTGRRRAYCQRCRPRDIVKKGAKR